jgi:hypothetical protein
MNPYLSVYGLGLCFSSFAIEKRKKHRSRKQGGRAFVNVKPVLTAPLQIPSEQAKEMTKLPH